MGNTHDNIRTILSSSAEGLAMFVSHFTKSRAEVQASQSCPWQLILGVLRDGLLSGPHVALSDRDNFARCLHDYKPLYLKSSCIEFFDEII